MQRSRRKNARNRGQDTERIELSPKITEWRVNKQALLRCPKSQDYYQEIKFKNPHVSETWVIN